MKKTRTQKHTEQHKVFIKSSSCWLNRFFSFPTQHFNFHFLHPLPLFQQLSPGFKVIYDDGGVHTRQTSTICVMINVELYFDGEKNEMQKVHTFTYHSTSSWWKYFSGNLKQMKKKLFSCKKSREIKLKVQETATIIELRFMSSHEVKKECLRKRLRSFTFSRLMKRYESLKKESWRDHNQW